MIDPRVAQLAQGPYHPADEIARLQSELASLRAQLIDAREACAFAEQEMEQALQVAGAGFHLAGDNMEGLRRALRQLAAIRAQQ